MPGGVAGSAVCRATAREQQGWLAAALGALAVEPAVRVWEYTAPAVVLGCSQRPSADLTRRAAAAGVPVFVRQTGGGAVLAGPWMLGATVVLPPRHPLVATSIPQSYRWFGVAHAAWLQGIGVDARAVPHAAASLDPTASWACFASLAPWEVEAGGGKIVGLAQARRRNGIAFSSAALIAPPPWELLCDVLEKPRTHAATLARRTSSCSQIVGRRAAADTLARSLLARLAAHAAAPRSPST